MLQGAYYTADDYTIFFQQGEEKGFAWFFRELYPALSFYCFKITGNKESSEEIASTAFIKIWERHEQFTDAQSIKAYLYRIVRNDALKHLEKQKRQATVNTEVVYLQGNQLEKDHFTALVSTETQRQLLQAINALPAECSKVFKLLYVEGKTIKEAAEQLRLSVSTVKTQKKRGIDALRKSMLLHLMVLAIAAGLLQH